MGKWGISNNSHVINLITEKEPKIKFFDFGVFQINEYMKLHDKIIFHMIFGAFQITPRTTLASIVKALQKSLLEIQNGFTVHRVI